MKIANNASCTSPEGKPRLIVGGASPTGVIDETSAAIICDSSSSDDDDDDNILSLPAPVPSPVLTNMNVKPKAAITKLFTSKEETHIFHTHKILGFSALASFIYRFCHVGERDGNFGPSYGTLLFIFHHWLLSASSFVFKIPQRRIRDGGFRIWPEYRIHSLVFASRSLACMMLVWFEQTTTPEHPWHIVDLLIVLGTMAAADYGSKSQGEHKSNSIRGTSYGDPYGHWWASECQFSLTAACLIGMRRYSVHLGALMIIQCNSFLMTLRRKNVASHEVLTATYGVLLLIGLLVAVLDDDYNDCMLPAGTYGNIAVIMRMGPLHLNKYALWTVLFLSLELIRTYSGAPVLNNHFWVYAFVITKICATSLGLKKRKEKMEKGQGLPRMVQIVMASHVVLFAHIYYLNFVAEYDD